MKELAKKEEDLRCRKESQGRRESCPGPQLCCIRLEQAAGQLQEVGLGGTGKLQRSEYDRELGHWRTELGKVRSEGKSEHGWEQPTGGTPETRSEPSSGTNCFREEPGSGSHLQTHSQRWCMSQVWQPMGLPGGSVQVGVWFSTKNKNAGYYRCRLTEK